MSKEAMKLALELEALTVKFSEGWHEGIKIDASDIMLLNDAAQALAEQPAQQKPVIRVNLDMTGAMATLPKTPSESVVEYKPVISDVGTECNIDVEARFFQPKGTGKITLHEPAQQAPVEWGVDWGKAGDIPCVSIIKRLPGGGIEVAAVEYGPQRTWVGLTDEEMRLIDPDGFEDNLPQMIQQALKEKNT